VPNFSEWRLGDIILVATDGGKAGRGIQAAQAMSRNERVREAARFTHAAVYIGDGMLIDATVQQPIMRRSVWHYCQRRMITLRRIPSAAVNAISPSDIEAIATAAEAHIGEAYSLSAAIFSKLIPNTEPDPKRLYCSTFVGLVITQATGLRLTASREHRPLHPATLAVHPELQTVPLEWRQPAVRALA
jgi:cell wall-associated NlpC family hydrolase